MNEPRRILLVGSSVDLRNGTEELLEGLGHHVLATADASGADLAPGNVDLAIVEAFGGTGTGTSGIEIVDALRRRRPDLPALLLTTYGEDPPLHERAAAGDVTVLAMPATAPALERAMAQALAARPPASGERQGSGLRRWTWVLLAAGLAVLVGLGMLLREAGPPPLPASPASTTVRGSTVGLLVPLGELAGPPRLLAWEAVAGASRYRIEILGVDDAVLWTTETEQTETPAPSRGLTLRPAVRYAWRVHALAADGTILSRSDRAWFEIVPAAGAARR